MYWYTREKGNTAVGSDEVQAVKQQEEQLMAEVCSPSLPLKSLKCTFCLPWWTAVAKMLCDCAALTFSRAEVPV